MVYVPSEILLKMLDNFSPTPSFLHSLKCWDLCLSSLICSASSGLLISVMYNVRFMASTYSRRTLFCSLIAFFKLPTFIAGIGFDQKGYIIANKEAIKVG